MSKSLNEQLKDACDRRQDKYRETVIAELEQVKVLLPRAKALVGLANELLSRRIPLGKRLSWWFKMLYCPFQTDPDYEFEVNGKYKIGFAGYYLEDAALVSRFKGDRRAEICIFANGMLDIHGPGSARLGIYPDKTVVECIDNSRPDDVLRIGSSERTIAAIRQLLDRFNSFEQGFNEYVKLIINQLEKEK